VRACDGYGKIARFRFHDLRHTYAALAIAAGVDIFIRRRWQRIERATLPPVGRSGEQALRVVTFGDDALWTPRSEEQI
jgi:hypothetical protein